MTVQCPYCGYEGNMIWDRDQYCCPNCDGYFRPCRFQPFSLSYYHNMYGSFGLSF